jgi:hypothetical protein
MLHDAHNALDDVIDKGEIALALAVVEYLDGLALTQFVGEAEVRHIRASGRTVNGEEAETGRWYVVELRIGMRHEFVALLSSGIEGNGVVNLVIGRVRHLLVAAIDRGRRGIDEMLNLVIATSLEDVVETYEIRLNVSPWISDRIAHASLSGEVNHHGRFVVGEQFVYQRFIGDITFDEDPLFFRPRTVGNGGNFFEAFALDVYVVVIVHAVDADYRDVFDIGKDALNEVGTNEACGSGDENRFGF